MTNPQDFLLNTDYELDKIILVKTGDFTGSVELPYSFNFIPLIFGVWSTDSNFTSVNSLGVTDSGAEPGYTGVLGVRAIAFSNRIKLTASGENSGTTKIYYRLYAFEPANSSADIAGTSNLANKFILNTDYNYRKLYAKGEFTQANQSYSHNLGYIPQIMAWAKYKNLPDWPEYNNGIEPVMFASDFTNFKVTVTNNTIATGSFPLNLVDKIIWRIYYDKA